MGRIQLISLCKPCVMSVPGPINVGRAVQTDLTADPTLLRYSSAITEQTSNIVALLFGDHGTKEMLGVVG